MAPLEHRPPYLPQALELFRRGEVAWGVLGAQILCCENRICLRKHFEGVCSGVLLHVRHSWKMRGCRVASKHWISRDDVRLLLKTSFYAAKPGYQLNALERRLSVVLHPFLLLFESLGEREAL